MKTRVIFFGELTDVVNSETEEFQTVPGTTLNVFLNSILEKYPGLADVNYSLFLNTRKANDLKVKLKANDILSLMPPFAGG